jgi:hypothetical protein
MMWRELGPALRSLYPIAIVGVQRLYYPKAALHHPDCLTAILRLEATSQLYQRRVNLATLALAASRLMTEATF